MAKEFQKNTMFIEQNPNSAVLENGDFRKNVDEDGRPRRTGIYKTCHYLQFLFIFFPFMHKKFIIYDYDYFVTIS